VRLVPFQGLRTLYSAGPINSTQALTGLTRAFKCAVDAPAPDSECGARCHVDASVLESALKPSTCASVICPAGFTLTGGGGACAAGGPRNRRLFPGTFTMRVRNRVLIPKQTQSVAGFNSGHWPVITSLLPDAP
jgi:hypothetical protein